MDRINEEAFAAINDVNGNDDPNFEAFLEEVTRRWTADPVAQALKIRSLAKQARVKTKLAVWRTVVQQEVLEDATTRVVQSPGVFS